MKLTKSKSGIGAELAPRLIKAGWRVACADLDVERGQRIVSKLGPDAEFFPVDIAVYSSQVALFQAVWRLWASIDALCANAGILDQSSQYILGHRGRGVQEIPPEPDLACTDMVYQGVVYGTQLAIHFMRHNQTPGGRIVATTSVSAIYPHHTYPEYSGVKAAMLNFMRSAAPCLRLKESILFNVDLPGIVPTRTMSQAMLDAVGADQLTPGVNGHPCVFELLGPRRPVRAGSRMLNREEPASQYREEWVGRYTGLRLAGGDGGLAGTALCVLGGVEMPLYRP